MPLGPKPILTVHFETVREGVTTTVWGGSLECLPKPESRQVSCWLLSKAGFRQTFVEEDRKGVGTVKALKAVSCRKG